MENRRLTDTQPISDQLPDLLVGLGSDNFIGLTGVQADLLFASAENIKGKPLMKPEHTHGNGCSNKRKGCKKS